MQRKLPVMDWMNLWPQPLHKNTKEKIHLLLWLWLLYTKNYYFYEMMVTRHKIQINENKKTEMLKQLKQKTMIDDHYWLEYVNMKRKWMKMDCNEKNDKKTEKMSHWIDIYLYDFSVSFISIYSRISNSPKIPNKKKTHLLTNN